VHENLAPAGQGVYHGNAHAVQAARHLVAVLVELAAGVQAAEHQLDRGLALFLVHVDRDAAAVVGDADDVTLADRHLDGRAVAGHRLVDRVVDDLVDEVVQALGARVADVHRRPLAHGLEALEDLDAVGVVLLGPVRRAQCRAGLTGRGGRRLHAFVFAHLPCSRFLPRGVDNGRIPCRNCNWLTVPSPNLALNFPTISGASMVNS